MSGAFLWLMTFMGSQLLLIAIGSLPLNKWRSFRDRKLPSDQASPDGGGPAPLPA